MRVRAVNTAADSDNKIHDDAIAARTAFVEAWFPALPCTAT